MAKRYGEGSEANDLVKKQLDEQQQLRLNQIKKTKIIIGVFLILVSLIIMVVNGFKANKINQACADLESQISSKRAELESKRKLASETDATQIVENVYSAQEAGKRVCEIQNELNTIDMMDEDETRMNELLVELRRYIPDNSSSSGNARNIWCYGHVWYFDSNYAMSLDSYPVIFTCYDKADTKKEKLLAYVIADYNVDSDTFSPVKLYTTTWLTDYDEALPNDDEGNEHTATDATSTDANTSHDAGDHIRELIDEYDSTTEATTEASTEATTE